jgi:hypothetical protein
MWTAEQVVGELQRRGELWQPASGFTALRGDALTLRRGVERALRRIALAHPSEEWQLPPALALETLARADYFASFPQWLTLAAHLTDDDTVLERVATAADPAAAAAGALAPPATALPPALCYHIYAAHEGRRLTETVCVTCQGTCWRHERARHAPLERGWAFTMREVVCLGDDAAVAAFLAGQRAALVVFASRLGLDPELAPAEDPFFAPTARGRTLLQRLRALKDELLLPVGRGRTVAAASFNNHDRFFGDAFGITLAAGTPAISGCAAYGVERWLLAVLVAHGPDARAWPDLDRIDVPHLDSVVRARTAAAPMPGAAASTHGAAPRERTSAVAVRSAGSAPRERTSAVAIRSAGGGRSLYARHAAAAERGAWSVERDIDWQRIDRALACSQPELLAQLRDAALIESFHPVNLARLMRATWDDVDAGVCFSLEAYEGFRHFHALRLYLEAIRYEPRITDEELVGIREAGALAQVESDELIDRLVEFMLSEHLASYFFRRLSEQSAEPVLRHLLALIAADEVRHAQSASDLVAKRIAADPSIVTRVLDAAAGFRHYGSEAVADVPVALHGDEVAIRTFANRIERLCGIRLVDHLKAQLRGRIP